MQYLKKISSLAKKSVVFSYDSEIVPSCVINIVPEVQIRNILPPDDDLKPTVLEMFVNDFSYFLKKKKLTENLQYGWMFAVEKRTINMRLTFIFDAVDQKVSAETKTELEDIIQKQYCHINYCIKHWLGEQQKCD